mmetsp:Transcript_5600/g.18730  ORF Transcript_5600/g.18730 Transcript_5600/m.18730 type:complete len:293 (-) Transcript_5600:47-925(-)
MRTTLCVAGARRPGAFGRGARCSRLRYLVCVARQAFCFVEQELRLRILITNEGQPVEFSSLMHFATVPDARYILLRRTAIGCDPHFKLLGIKAKGPQSKPRYVFDSVPQDVLRLFNVANGRGGGAPAAQSPLAARAHAPILPAAAQGRTRSEGPRDQMPCRSRRGGARLHRDLCPDRVASSPSKSTLLTPSTAARAPMPVGERAKGAVGESPRTRLCCPSGVAPSPWRRPNCRAAGAVHVAWRVHVRPRLTFLCISPARPRSPRRAYEGGLSRALAAGSRRRVNRRGEMRSR